MQSLMCAVGAVFAEVGADGSAAAVFAVIEDGVVVAVFVAGGATVDGAAGGIAGGMDARTSTLGRTSTTPTATGPAAGFAVVLPGPAAGTGGGATAIAFAGTTDPAWAV